MDKEKERQRLSDLLHNAAGRILYKDRSDLNDLFERIQLLPLYPEDWTEWEDYRARQYLEEVRRAKV